MRKNTTGRHGTAVAFSWGDTSLCLCTASVWPHIQWHTPGWLPRALAVVQCEHSREVGQGEVSWREAALLINLLTSNYPCSMKSAKANIIVPVLCLWARVCAGEGGRSERCAERGSISGTDLPAIHFEAWEWTKGGAFKRERLGVFWEKAICFYVYFYWFVSVDTVSIVLLKFEKNTNKMGWKHQFNDYHAAKGRV